MEIGCGTAGHLGQTSVCSLPLQISLYFNCVYFPFWWVCHLVMFQVKYEHLSAYYRITLIALILVMTLVEVVRLYLGYVGNLQEKVPQLAGSWLLTLLLQLPMLLFQLLTPHLWVLPAEWASSLFYLALLLSQALLALLALRRLASQLEARFRLSHLRLGEAWGPSAAPPSWR
ncbi:transmembrane protein 17-like [Mobula hypostoma]|uniref:transmembrane protein 17-like n=1 Tax=Mobula hypostoma TaxID=723540 RepID=UPI002FC321E0